MKVALVGLGKMGLLHMGVLNTFKEVKITSIAEKENLVSKYLRNILSDVSVYDDHEKMFKDEELDIVYITTPIGAHFPIMESCIKNRINFFVEKPLSRNLDEAKIICSELKKSNIIHAVGYDARFYATFSKAKSLLDQEILGDVTDVKSSMYVSNIFSKPSGWRFKKKSAGGGVLLSFGCHLVDLLLWYFGPIKNVLGETKSLYSSVEDFAHMKMKFANGINGEFDTSWSVRGYRMSEINVEIKGDNGKLIVNQDFIDIKLKKPISKFNELNTRIYKQSLNELVSFDVGGPNYTNQDQYVIKCVKEKRLPQMNVFEASKTQSVIQAVYDSAETNSEKMVEYID